MNFAIAWLLDRFMLSRRPAAGGVIRGALAASVALGLSAAGAAAAANLIQIGVGSTYQIGAGSTVDTGCADVLVQGTLSIGAGKMITVRNLTVEPGGVLDFVDGTLQLSGSFTNSGTFNAGSGTVQFMLDVPCSAAAGIVGSNQFNNLIFNGPGGRLAIAAGSQQSVGGLLQLTGSAASPLAIVSATPGTLANINLLPAARQSLSALAVTDVAATGQWLALNQTNAPGAGPAPRWFGVIEIPTLSPSALTALAVFIALLVVVVRAPRRAVRI